MFPLLLKHITRRSSWLVDKTRSSSSEAGQKIHALVTGPPGVGKTTLVRKVCSQLREREESIEVRGFTMEEVREGYMWEGQKYPGPKIGFDVISTSGSRGPLARVDIRGLHHFKFGKGTARKRKKNIFVGKYRVMLRSFEKIALPSLQISITPLEKDGGENPSSKTQLYVVDEIGEMGLFSKGFITSVRALLRQGPQPPPKNKRIDPIVVMATFPESGQTHKLLKEIKSREDCTLFEVNKDNRDTLVTEISDFISQKLSQNLD